MMRAAVSLSLNTKRANSGCVILIGSIAQPFRRVSARSRRGEPLHSRNWPKHCTLKRLRIHYRINQGHDESAEIQTVQPFADPAGLALVPKPSSQGKGKRKMREAGPRLEVLAKK